MNVLRVGVCVLALSALAGCGVFGSKRVDYGADAQQSASLELPPDLVVRAGDDSKSAQGDAGSVATYSDYSKTITPAAELKTSADGSGAIIISEPFDKSWRKVGLAIERAALPIEDRDRSKGIYYLRSTKAQSGKKSSKDGGEMRYQVTVKDGGASCEISTADQTGTSDDESRKLLVTLHANLNQ